MNVELLSSSDQLVIADRLPLGAMDRGINLVANHPVKMLILLFLSQYPDKSFSVSQLQHGMNAVQGAERAWDWDDQRTAIEEYCQGSLVPSNFVCKTEVQGKRGKNVSGFGITRFGQEFGVPLSGAGLDLELRTAYSSQRAFARVRSNTIQHTGWRHQILTADLPKEVVAELLYSFEAVRGHEGYRALAAEQGLSIINTPEAVTYLLQKARLNSKTARTPIEQAPQQSAIANARFAGWVGLDQLLTFGGEWRDDAACRTKDPALFFPDDDAPIEEQVAVAKQICGSCPVRIPCLKFALEMPGSESWGVWGGDTPQERKYLPLAEVSLLNLVTLRD